ncbi:unnamed protein product, partial [Scytosiphon promiscuus]
SGFEDAVASPVCLQADDQTRVTSAARAGSPIGDPKSLKGSTAVAGTDEPPSLSKERQQSSSERVHVDGTEGMEAEDRRQAPKEARQELVPERSDRTTSGGTRGVSTTPFTSGSRFAEDDAPVSEVATPGGEGTCRSASPVFGTPAHSRNRSIHERGPPITVSGAGSRRVHRGRNRTDESLAASLSEDTHRAAAATSEISSPSPSVSRPGTNVNGLPIRRAKKKTYSHVSDTTWLKRKTDLPKAAPSPPELQPEVGTAFPLADRCIPSRTSARSTEEESTSSAPACAAAPVDTAGDVPAPLSARVRNQRRFPKRGCCNNLTTHKTLFAPSDSHVETPSVHDCTEGSQADERGVADVTDAADEAVLDDPADNNVPSDAMRVNFAVDQVEANGQQEAKEEDIAGRVGMEHEGGSCNEYQDKAIQEGLGEDGGKVFGNRVEGDATIGAKRASIGNKMDMHGPDWFLDPPEGFAPSKRGKAQPKYPLAVMRHSARLDDAIHERQRKLGAMAASGRSSEDVAEKGGNDGSKDLENGDDELEAVPWPDRAQRPYDSPILDTDLPARQARELCRLGMNSQTLIVSSPFRRCLQTAGVVARTLGVAGVTVHLEVGERMDKVRREIAELALAHEEECGRAFGSKQPVPCFSYLEEADMRGALGAGVSLEQIVGEQPPEGESGVEAKQRFIATIAKVREEKLCDRPVLVVAHGDTLDAAGESLASQIVFEADYCAWALFDLDTHCGYVTESYGIQMIPL